MSEARVVFNVLDISSHLPGPIAANLLAGLGGDVIKIERPHVGDGNRAVSVPERAAPRVFGESVYHLAVNAGCRSIAVDRRSPHWGIVVEACVRWADVVIVGGRIADAKRWAIDFDTLRSVNPAIVYLALTGYGLTGPLADLPAHGQNPDAFAGNVMTQVDADGHMSTLPGWRTAGTTLAGTHGALGVMAALYRRQVTGDAQFVDVSLWRSAVWWGWRDFTSLANAGIPFPDFHEFGSRYAIYATKDNAGLLIAAMERKFWERFCDVCDLRDLRSVGDWSSGAMFFGHGPDDPEAKRIARVIRQSTLKDWMSRLKLEGVPHAPIHSHRDALESVHMQEQEMMVTLPYRGRTLKVMGAPIRISNSVERSDQKITPSHPPDVGEHTEDILGQFGLDRIVGNAIHRSADGGAWVE